MKRRVGTQMLIALSMVSLLAACTKDNDSTAVESTKKVEKFNVSGLPIVNEKISLTASILKAAHHGDFNDMEMVKRLEKLTNVHIKWDQIPAESIKERNNLMFASHELPDIFFAGLNSIEVVQYGSQGLLVPLNDLIDKYAPNIKKFLNENPNVKKAATTPDGKIYALPWVYNQPYFEYRNSFFLNQEWLKKLNLKAPTTTEELYTVLKAFKEKDPNGNGKADEIPLGMIYSNLNNSHHVLYGAFGVLEPTGSKLAVVDGKVRYEPVQPAYKEAITYFHRLYQEGLIDLEAFTQDQKKFNAKIANKDVALYGSFTSFNGGETGSNERLAQYVPIEPVAGPSGDRFWRRQDNRMQLNYFSISSSNKQPEISMRLADAMNEGELKYELHRGPFGTHLTKSADGKITEVAPPASESQAVFKGKVAPLNFIPLLFSSKEALNVAESAANDARNVAYETIYKDNIVPEKNTYPSTVYSTLEEADKLKVLDLDIDSYVSEMEVKWIVRGGIDEEWDNYIKEINNMGLKDKLKIHQGIYDRYMKN
ncbi:extracellular solute-binding protein [Paenibacillus sp. WQ 127069]|uniref:Extracellular solute-binding protein n=1 Tax=Paenibacillus baimaensis TaxID=2982185 RepID=A0ABT2UD15_9BACL|nr:extracellular solute-binding protein [Paenibacillus sp. WQ 127069]MCU6792526.1 extracellular solute-binding protein [Paenibacillus sp. WQ 127069]